MEPLSYLKQHKLWQVLMKYNAILAVFLTVASLPAMAADDDRPLRAITVSGEAKEEVAPDQAVLSGQILSKAKQLATAKLDNDKLAQRVYEITKKFEIPKEKIAASNVYISPEYNYNNKTNKQELIGYIVSRNLSITMEKLDVHEQLLSALVEAGIDQVNSVAFTIAKPEAREDALRVKAVQNAKARAEMLAGAAGAKLGKVITINMEGAYAPPVMPMRMMKAEAAGGVANSSAPSLPGMNMMSQRVSVTFELE
jgi:uncharacterized protein YggE